jgi:hypothetical protein
MTNGVKQLKSQKYPAGQGEFTYINDLFAAGYIYGMKTAER